jgi:hypothetical protein
MVHLEGSVPTVASGAAYGPMSLFDLIEGVLRVSLPSSQGAGGHGEEIGRDLPP